MYFNQKCTFLKKRSSCGWAYTSKVETSHFFALESISYVNKYSKTEIFAFCYWQNKLVIGLRVVKFRGNRVVISNRSRATRSADLKLLARLLPELYSTQSYYHY